MEGKRELITLDNKTKLLGKIKDENKPFLNTQTWFQFSYVKDLNKPQYTLLKTLYKTTKTELRLFL